MAACGVTSTLVSSALNTRALAAATPRASAAARALFPRAYLQTTPQNAQVTRAYHSRFLGGLSLGSSQASSLHGSVVAKSFVRCSARTKMTIAVGDELPEAMLSYFDSENNMQVVNAKDLVKGKKVVLFAVPGAFTPTCSLKHLPSFVDNADKLKAKGIDTIACVAVNDAFVMQAWGKQVGAEGKILLLADGSGQFAKALGVELDLVDKGLGIRSRRYFMLVDDGKVAALNLEEGGAFSTSGADDILKAL